MAQTAATESRSLAELNAIIAEATAQKARMYEAELERLVREVSERCEQLQMTPAQLWKELKKSKAPRGRGRPRKDKEEAGSWAAE
jgi:hypothetical protein